MTEWIISSAVLIVVVALVRQLLKGKISLQLQYALWAIVLVRLLVPVSFGQTKFSVQNVVQAGQTVQTEQSEPAETSGITIDIPPSRLDYEGPDLAATVTESVDAEGNVVWEEDWEQWEADMDADWEKYKAENTRHVTLSVTDILYLVWIAGMAVTALIFALSNLRFRLRLRRSRRPLEAVSRLPVYLTGAVETPCLFGLFRPAVYVTPEVAEDEVALGHVLAHEETHCSHGDHVWALLRCLCLVIHWYNPLVWMAAALSRRDAELACDAGTIRRIGEGERAAYGSTLIGLTCAHRGNLLHTATTMTGSKKSIKERIVLIAKKPKMAVYTLIAVILIAAVAVGCTFTGAKEKKHPFIERIADVTEFSIGGAYIGSEYRVPTTDYDDLLSILQSITEEQCIPVTELDFGNNITYRLRISTGLDEEWQFYCLQDEENTVGVIFLDEEGKAEAYFDGEKMIYPTFPDLDGCWLKIRSPELYQYIMGSIEDFRNGTVADPDVPEAVLEKAEELLLRYLNEKVAEYADTGESWEFTSAMSGLGRLEIDTDRAGAAVKMYQMEYDITGQHKAENLNETRESRNTCYLIFLDSDIRGTPVFVGAIDLIECATLYGTREMILKYGDMYTAAAAELYQQYVTAPIPAFVQVAAEFQMELRRAEAEQEMVAVSVTHEILSELKGLSKLELGTAGLDYAVEMWQMDYDITVAFGQGQDANTTGHTVYLVFLYDYISEQYTRLLGSVDEETLLSVYNTQEMINQYGDMYRAAAMELYSQYAEASKQLNTPVSPSDGLYNLTKRGKTVSLTLHTKEGGEQRTFVLDYQSDAWKTTGLNTGVSWNLLSEAPEGTWDYWLTYTSEDGTASVTFYAGKNGPVCYRDEQRTIWWTERGGTPDAETLREEVYDPLVTSVAPEYDVFSDPNVLWGDGLDIRGDLMVMPRGTVEISGQLTQLIGKATEDSLIAFSVENHGTLVGLGTIDLTKVVIHEVLDNNGELSGLIKRYNSTIGGNPAESFSASQEIGTYVTDFADDHVGQTISRMYAICREKHEEILNSGYIGDSEELSKELKSRLLEDEEFCSLYYGDFMYYTDMILEFYRTFYLQSALPVREQFCEWGFAPIYQSGDFESVISDMDAFESSDLWFAFEQKTMGGTFLRNIGFAQKIFSFVGTAEQILQIENRIGDEECYWLMTAARP